MAQANIKAVITAEDKASGVISRFGDNTAKTTEKVQKSSLASKVALVGSSVAVAGFLKTSLGAWEEQELAVTRLQRGIENVTSATSKNIDGLIKQAQALQKTTRFSDEQYESAQGILTTFQLNQDAISKLTPRLADMSEGLARASGEMPDLEGNAMLVAKALGGEDVTGLVGALRRVGVIMTDHQQEILKTGNMQERLSTITQVLDQNFKGMAEAAGTTTAGKVTQLKNSFNDLQEKVGEVMSKALLPIIDFFTKHPVTIYIFTGAITALATAFIGLKIAAGVQGALGAMQSLVTWLGGPAAAAGFFAIAGVAVAAGVMIMNAANQAKAAWNNAGKAVEQAGASADAVMGRLKDLMASGTPEQRARAKATMQGLAAGGWNYTYQSGTSFASGGSAIVGEAGPEIVNLPYGSEVIPNTEINRVSSPINIHISAGAFMGTQLEARKFAKLIIDAYNDLASAKNLKPIGG